MFSFVTTARRLTAAGCRDKRPDEIRIWASASSLRQVGDLVAAWLSGDLASQPGYYGPVDVDEVDVPGLTRTLMALNRAGFVTTTSQAGTDGDGWEQIAAVVGFASPEVEAWLLDALDGVDGVVVLRCVPTPWWSLRQVEPVTWYRGRAVTDFGSGLSERAIRDRRTGYGLCAPGAVRELVAARQLLIRETDVGRNDRLWPALFAVALQHQPREPRN